MAGGLSLYAEGESLLHRAHPLTKGALSVSAIALAFTFPSVPSVVAEAAVLLGLMALAGVLRRLLAVALVILLPISVLLLAVQGFANPSNRTLLIALGPVALYREGILVAIGSALRISCLVTATFLLSFTTRPPDLKTSARPETAETPRKWSRAAPALMRRGPERFVASAPPSVPRPIDRPNTGP